MDRITTQHFQVPMSSGESKAKQISYEYIDRAMLYLSYMHFVETLVEPDSIILIQKVNKWQSTA